MLVIQVVSVFSVTMEEREQACLVSGHYYNTYYVLSHENVRKCTIEHSIIVRHKVQSVSMNKPFENRNHVKSLVDISWW